MSMAWMAASNVIQSRLDRNTLPIPVLKKRWSMMDHLIGVELERVASTTVSPGLRAKAPSW
jgi:hypothetical protein